jgi:hypothetical protein
LIFELKQQKKYLKNGHYFQFGKGLLVLWEHGNGLERSYERERGRGELCNSTRKTLERNREGNNCGCWTLKSHGPGP